MRLIIVGCEYAGKTTLVGELAKWAKRALGAEIHAHDHFIFPSPELPADEQDKLRGLGTKAKEMFQRYMIEYHLLPAFYLDNDHILVGYHIEEAVYAPLYYGYGRPGEYGERSALAREIEQRIMTVAPDTALVLVKASPWTIRERMRKEPHSQSVLEEKDVEFVLRKFDEEYEKSLIRRRFLIDNTNLTVGEAFKKFLELMEPHFTPVDRLRVLTHQVLKEEVV